MLDNLLRPYLLARVLLGASVLLALAYGAMIAARGLARPHATDATEAALAQDRRSELIAVIVKVAAACATLGLLATVLAADRAHHAIRGAMCAYGVLTSTEHGVASLVTSTLLFLGASAWLALHHLDLGLVRGDLVTTKLRGVLLLAPLALVDFVYVTRFVTELNFDVVASCCSTSADASGAETTAYGIGTSYPMLGVALASLLAGALLLARAVRRPSVATRVAAGTCLLVGAALMVPAAMDVVAPHVYGSPVHRCPFCLLHGEALFLGYPLLVALLFAAHGAVSVLVGSLFTSRFPEAATLETSRLAGRTIAFALMLVALAVIPIARYVAVSGTLLRL